MTVATLRLDLRVLLCRSARERRREMQAIMDRLHRSFNVSVADADSAPGGEIDRTVLVVVAVGRARRDARLILDRVADAVAAHPRAEVLAHEFTEV